MKSGQRVIKYLAIALAIFIIVSIVSAVLFAFNIFSDILGLTRGSNSNMYSEIENSEMMGKKFENSQIASVKMELAYSTLTIQEGDSFTIETNSKDVESRQSGNQLIIKEKTYSIISGNKQRVITLTIPRDTILDTVKIEAGAGEIKIAKLACKNLELEMGAGKVTIQDLQVTKKAKLEGGAGKVEILSGDITNLDLDMGIGSFTLATSLSGNNKIEAGVGKLELKLTDGLDNYTIRASKGIGSIKIGDKEIKNNVEHGTGETYLKIDGGVGSIEIK